MKKISIGFLGYGTRALDALMEDERFEVKAFFAPLSRLCEDVYDAKKKYPGPEFGIVKDNDDVRKAFERYKGKVECFLMNACPIILNQQVLDVMPVYNIHPGNLTDNRGHQPHLWTVLLAEKESEIVLHEVNPGIDEGKIIAKKIMSIDDSMDSLQVLNLLEDEIPYLLDGLYDHLVNGTPPMEAVFGGEYRRVMVYQDYEFSPENMDAPGFLEDVLRKIRARAMHHGAYFIYRDERIYVDRLLDDERLTEAGGLNGEVEIEFHGTVVMLRKNDRQLVFRLNKREQIR
ncbi:MAG: hypothetical protein K6G45_07630 [Lachnospiraceae bacterium]|nr:hypothetical protein [Lachnospiraceae bacterium]